ncbi:hypothetical protein J437_LFUL002620 [Ladona fulva]|uniref:G-protein coupled receptors family 2 profile 1 domain-containing protein n=1 Tax=Ladona fulva TaxID=123851 RepID=A0A8K0JUH1_LADFU|nr:hypothetical protein J437_LFUL002620 [Ladona fulva]
MKRQIVILTVLAVLFQSCMGYNDGLKARHQASGKFAHHRHRGHRKDAHHPHHHPPPPMALPLNSFNASIGESQEEPEIGTDFHDKELECLVEFEIEPYPTLWREGENGVEERVEDAIFCNRSWDKLLCWPTTLAATLAILPCFEELNGIKYDTTPGYVFPVNNQEIRLTVGSPLTERVHGRYDNGPYRLPGQLKGRHPISAVKKFIAHMLRARANNTSSGGKVGRKKEEAIMKMGAFSETTFITHHAVETR